MPRSKKYEDRFQPTLTLMTCLHLSSEAVSASHGSLGSGAANRQKILEFDLPGHARNLGLLLVMPENEKASKFLSFAISQSQLQLVYSSDFSAKLRLAVIQSMEIG